MHFIGHDEIILCIQLQIGISVFMLQLQIKILQHLLYYSMYMNRFFTQVDFLAIH